jgi:hypothetical protein
MADNLINGLEAKRRATWKPQLHHRGEAALGLLRFFAALSEHRIDHAPYPQATPAWRRA